MFNNYTAVLIGRIAGCAHSSEISECLFVFKLGAHMGYRKTKLALTLPREEVIGVPISAEKVRVMVAYV